MRILSLMMMSVFLVSGCVTEFDSCLEVCVELEGCYMGLLKMDYDDISCSLKISDRNFTRDNYVQNYCFDKCAGGQG